MRGQAIRALLAAWRLETYFDTAIAMLRSDPDESVRADAASALGSFILLDPDPPEVTQQQRDAAFEALLQAFLRDPDRLVQKLAYRDIHQMLTGWRPAFPEWFDREADADWELLAPYLPPEQLRPPRPRPAAVSTDEDEALLSDPQASPDALAAAIDRVEADRLYELAWPLTRLQYHESPLVRGRALLALTRTWREDDVDLIREMLQSDPGWQARAGAAGALPYLLQTYSPFRERVRELLMDALIREADSRVEAAIKESLEQVDDPAFPPGPVWDDVTGMD